MTRRAIVTGAGHGIGAAIARRLAEAGYRVGVFDIDIGRTAAIAAGLPGAVALTADVADEDQVRAAFDTFGATPDLVVNNAGIVRFGALVDQSVADFALTVRVNLLGCYVVSREAARRMLSRGAGHIVNITSINSRTPGPGAGAYPATKAAIVQLTRQMAIECGPGGVRVNAIAPGFIDAGMSEPIYQDPQTRASRAAGVPLKRLGTADDIASAVLYLDSDNSAYINGHELVVDGGVVHSLLAQLPRN